jgi:CTP-dependent riboflavin kinase
MKKLVGRLRSGEGDFSNWIRKLEPFYTQKTGLKLFPGTLNLHLVNQSYSLPRNCLRLEKEEYGGTVSVSIVPCTIFGRPAFILRTDSDEGKHGDPQDAILEIATDVKLRDAYGLEDGDLVEVEVMDEAADNPFC